MEDKLFDTDGKKKSAIMQFESLEAHQGWQLVVKIVQMNIKVLRKQLEEGVEGQTMDDVNRLRDKIRDHENFINTPTRMKENLSSADYVEEDDDPYSKGTEEALDK